MIYVDGDACPVKGEIEQVATRHRMPVKIVANGGLRPSRNPLVEMAPAQARGRQALYKGRSLAFPLRTGKHHPSGHEGLKSGYVR